MDLRGNPNAVVARDRTRKIRWAMLNRCFNTEAPNYPNYGERGITVCERWLDFNAFLEDMGYSPKGLYLDRIDNDGNYEPGNCRWVDVIVSASNRRGTVLLTHDGETATVAEWSRRTGLSQQLIHKRLHNGWSVADALSPAQQKYHNRRAA